MQRRAIHTRGFFKHEAKPRAAGSESFHSKSVRVLRGRFGNHNRLKAAGAATSTRAHVAGEQGVCTKTCCEGEPEGSAPQIWRRERPLHGSHFGRAIGWSWPVPAVGPSSDKTPSGSEGMGAGGAKERGRLIEPQAACVSGTLSCRTRAATRSNRSASILAPPIRRA